MRSTRIAAIMLCATLTGLLISSASLSNQVTGLDLASFEGREVLVIRTTGNVPAPGTYNRNSQAATVTFSLPGVGADSVKGIEGGSLITGVAVSNGSRSGADFTVTLASSELVDQSRLRFSQPSDHVVLLEVFPLAISKSGAALITDVSRQLGLAPLESPAGATAAPGAVRAAGDSDISSLGITTLNLSSTDTQRVLSLAAATGLLDISSSARVATQNLGELSVKPAGQSLVNWCAQSPPGELFLSGTPAQIAEFVSLADSRTLAAQPTFEQYWAANKPPTRVRPASIGGSSATRSRMKDDPYAGIYYSDMFRESRLLSDIRVTLPAISGMNLYDVLNYLSLISGISLIIDPYTFDEPTGMRRDPLEPDPPAGDNSGPGFRPASVFQPQTGRPGTVIGNFDNVPFDLALKLILETHGLEFVVYGGESGSKRYGKSGGGSNDYEKPVVLVTSRERLEQEIGGTNQIDLYQFHYADPFQISQILNSLNMMPGEDSGWFIYQGGGSGGTLGRGGGGNPGGGSGGGRGGSTYAAESGLLVYRGSDRAVVHDEVAQAAADGENLVRVLLRPESGNQLVTAFAR